MLANNLAAPTLDAGRGSGGGARELGLDAARHAVASRSHTLMRHSLQLRDGVAERHNDRVCVL